MTEKVFLWKGNVLTIDSDGCGIEGTDQIGTIPSQTC